MTRRVIAAVVLAALAATAVAVSAASATPASPWDAATRAWRSVSYTHLTLPTKA